MGKYRPGRLGEEIRRIISGMLLTDVKDPRLAGKMISITGVDVTSDGSYATCYVSVLRISRDKLSPDDGGQEEENRDVIEGLESAKGIFKTEIGRQVKLRHVPELVFKIDSSMVYGRHIDSIIKELNIKPEDADEGPDFGGEDE